MDENPVESLHILEGEGRTTTDTIQSVAFKAERSWCILLKTSTWCTHSRSHITLTSPYITHINMRTFLGSGSCLVEETTGNIHKQTTTRCLRAERRPTQTELSVLPLCFCRGMTRQSSIKLPTLHTGHKKHYHWNQRAVIRSCSTRADPQPLTIWGSAL